MKYKSYTQDGQIKTFARKGQNDDWMIDGAAKDSSIGDPANVTHQVRLHLWQKCASSAGTMNECLGYLAAKGFVKSKELPARWSYKGTPMIESEWVKGDDKVRLSFARPLKSGILLTEAKLAFSDAERLPLLAKLGMLKL